MNKHVNGGIDIDLEMETPDARSDLVGAVAFLVDCLPLLARRLARLEELTSMRTFTVEDLATMQGCADSTLRGNPWKLPNFGRPDIGGHPRRWLAETVRSWYSRPEDERRREWDRMTSKERLQALGRTA